MIIRTKTGRVIAKIKLCPQRQEMGIFEWTIIIFGLTSAALSVIICLI